MLRIPHAAFVVVLREVLRYRIMIRTLEAVARPMSETTHDSHSSSRHESQELLTDFTSVLETSLELFLGSE